MKRKPYQSEEEDIMAHCDDIFKELSFG